jgi:small subunit ribosomal protein S21
MLGVKIKDGEPYEVAMRRFKKMCEKGGLMAELRKREYYMKPSVRKKRKTIAARKRIAKMERRMASPPPVR